MLPLLLCAAATLAPPQGGHRPLGPLLREAGWIELFDGRTTAGWRGIGKEAFPEQGWSIEDGCLVHSARGGGGDLVTTEEYGDFELELEWRVAAGANSGIKYRVRDQPGTGAAFGPEYQILDDAGHRDGGSRLTSAASMYGVMAPEGPEGYLRPAGEWNLARIVSRGDRIEHWINGHRVVDLVLGSETWTAAVGRSKFRNRPDYAAPGPGRIALQDHGDEVAYRNLRLRELPGPGEPVPLLAGGTLDAFHEYGDAVYTLEDDTILGEVGGGSQSFLVSKEEFGDFLFEVEVRTELPGNSGIQIRSHALEGGRPYGYQVEIDPSPRAWSGGLYDEHRRGWLAPLEGNEPARAAYRHGEWNRFRIETLGPWFRVRVNGIETTHHFDTYDLEGFLAFQVHSGNNTRVRWRAPRLLARGTRAWEAASDWRELSGDWERTDDTWRTEGSSAAALELATDPEGVPSTDLDLSLRLEFRAPTGGLAVQLFEPDGEDRNAFEPLYLLDASRSEHLDPDGWNTLSVGLLDGELSFNVAGRPVVRSMAAPPDSHRVRPRLWSLGTGPVEVRAVELLR